jgi:anti-sigma factor RsiW
MPARDQEHGEHVQMLLGAYLLGGLTAQDQAAVRRHLTLCSRCRIEHDELAEVTDMLSMLSADDFSAAGGKPAPAPPAEPEGPASS